MSFLRKKRSGRGSRTTNSGVRPTSASAKRSSATGETGSDSRHLGPARADLPRSGLREADRGHRGGGFGSDRSAGACRSRDRARSSARRRRQTHACASKPGTRAHRGAVRLCSCPRSRKRISNGPATEERPGEPGRFLPQRSARGLTPLRAVQVSSKEPPRRVAELLPSAATRRVFPRQSG